MDHTGKVPIIAFVGIGMIAGSLAKALKKADFVGRVIAYDNSKTALEMAVSEDVIDEAVGFSDIERADIIILATPVQAFYQIINDLARLNLKENVIITDVGSTKGSVIKAFEQAFGNVPDYFIPAHPIAGREKSGVLAAQEDLFKNKRVILTTSHNMNDRALGVISKMWLATGALISYMSVAEHDEILGATSHLPHVLAYLLVDMLDQDLHNDEIFDYAAGGFRDFTRIASSSPVMWRDICMNNVEVIQKLLETYRTRITQFEKLLMNYSGDEIEKIFARAKMARDEHYQKEANL